MAARRYNPRLAKSRENYEIAEIAELYGCHRNTVRHWLKSGLEPIDGRRPIYVHGTALNAFHAARRQASKRPCEPGQFYCLPCHKRQRPAGDMVDCKQQSPKLWKISAICPDCGRLLNQKANAARLDQFRALFDVADTKPPPPIGDTDAPSANSDFERKVKSHET